MVRLGAAVNGPKFAWPSDSPSASPPTSTSHFTSRAEAGQYISQYNIWMYHLLTPQGQRLFPPKMRLLSHWNLRDEIKADYPDKENGLAKQRMIQQVMERIVTQTIPQSVINNPGVDWNPYSNEVTPRRSEGFRHSRGD